MTRITTHVLDTALGRPGAGLAVRLERIHGRDATLLAETVTDADGRVREWLPAGVGEGSYRLTFATGTWFAAAGRDTLYPEVVIGFDVRAGEAHYHIPLLLAPFGYTTYRGT